MTRPGNNACKVYTLPFDLEQMFQIWYLLLNVIQVFFNQGCPQVTFP